MSMLMVEFNWDHVTVFYSADAVGQKSLNIFQNISREYRLCIATDKAVSYTTTRIPETASTGVVYLGSQGVGEDPLLIIIV